jgi:hypothetical protein
VITPEELKYTRKIIGMMEDSEIEWIARLSSTVSSWTEVGVYCGKSAVAAGLGLPSGGLLQLVDCSIRRELFSSLLWLMDRRPNLEVILCKAVSVDAAKILRSTDVVFIDDNHSYEGVKASINAWKDKCRILCGHDYSLPEWTSEPNPDEGVRIAVDEFFKITLPVSTGCIWLREV